MSQPAPSLEFHLTGVGSVLDLFHVGEGGVSNDQELDQSSSSSISYVLIADYHKYSSSINGGVYGVPMWTSENFLRLKGRRNFRV